MRPQRTTISSVACPSAGNSAALLTPRAMISTSPCESFLVPSPPRNSRPLTLYVPWSANGLDVLARHTYSHTEAAVSKA